MKGGASLEANPVADVIDTQAPPSPFCEQDAPESAFAEGEAAEEQNDEESNITVRSSDPRLFVFRKDFQA